MRERILAGEAVGKYGESLVGREISTIPFGYWPGGRAMILELYHDPTAPEIVLQVKATPNNTMVTAAIANGHLDDDQIGVFENEEIEIDMPGLLTEEESQLVIGAIPLQALPDSES